MIARLKAIAVIAGLAALLLAAGCAKKQVVATKPEPVVPPPSPTATLQVSPATIQQGQSAELTWKTQNATEINIAGLGTVAASGSQRVKPNTSTTYDLKATGPGGTATDSARLTVNAATAVVTPPKETEEELFRRYVKDVYFDYDKYNIRADGQQAVAATAQFLQQHPQMKVLIEGHCDERGSEDYNVTLGENRAGSVREALVALGIPAARLRVISYGKERPFCTQADEACYQQNRRGHFALDR